MSNTSDVDDTATSAFSTNAQAIPMILTIPAKMILDEMLRQLELPFAQYDHKVYEDHKICVTVVFHVSKQSHLSSAVPVTIPGARSMDKALAQHTARPLDTWKLILILQ